MEKIDGKTYNLTEEKKRQLMELFPEAVSEGKINVERLLLAIGEDRASEEEKFEFRWKGKKEAIQLAQKQTTGTLRPVKEESVNWDSTNHLYIEGDNLEVLRVLQQSYRNKIKVIYIDPPYNTGKDFVYKDNFHDNVENYKERLKESYKSNAETSGRYHTDWLNMMYPRLMLAKSFLTDDGVIFISIDDHEVFNLKKICDEIFGENNFIEMFSWKKTSTPANLSNKTKKSLEYILLYQKRDAKELKGLTKFSKSTNGLMNQTNRVSELIFPKYITETSLKDGVYPAGKYGTSAYDIELLADTEVKDGKFIKDVYLRGKFKWSQNYLDEQIKAGVKVYIKTAAFSPSYEKDEYEPEKPWNIIDASFNVGTNENASDELDRIMGPNFSDGLYPKPTSLIKYLINMAAGPEDYIMDFFSGSATTGHAVMELNAEDGGKRKFILVQLPEETNQKSEAFRAGYKKITEIGKERLRRAGAQLKEKTDYPIDIGFKVFHLDTTNIKQWDEQEEDLEASLLDQIQPLKDGRNEEDVVYEILLKYGLELTVPVEKKTWEKKNYYSVGHGEILIALDKDIQQNFVEHLAQEYQHCRIIVFFDEGFHDDTMRLNVEQLLKQYGITNIHVI